jgi:hypothetical protein
MNDTRPSPVIEDWLARQGSRPMPWMVAFAVLLAIQISPWWYPTPDAAAYLSIARSIAVSHRLANLGGIHLGYPPGYPLLMSPAFLISARPFVVLSFMQWLIALVFMAGVYRWFGGMAPQAAVLLTGLVMVNVAFWIYFRRTLSELAFMTVMIWTVLALNAALDARTWRAIALRTAIGTALLIALVMIRETGVLLTLGFAVAALLNIRDARLRWTQGLWMTAMVASPAIAGVAAFLLYDLATAHAAPSLVFGTHLSPFVDTPTPMVPRVIEGLRLRISEVGRLIVPGMFKAYAAHSQWVHINTVIYLAVFALIALGWWRLTRRRRDVFAASVPFYFILYVVWAFDADTRYLLPILPVIVASLWFAIEPFTNWRLTAVAALLVIHLAIALGYWAAVEIPRGRQCNQEWTSVAPFVAAARDQTGLIVATDRIPQCARLMLSFLIDRPVPEPLGPGQYPDPQGIFEGWDEHDPPGFRVAHVDMRYKLLVRVGTPQPSRRLNN